VVASLKALYTMTTIHIFSYCVFCNCLLADINRLQPLLHPSAPITSRTSLLKLLSALLVLDPVTTLNPAQNPAFDFVLTAYKQLLSEPGKQVQQRQLVSDALQLLGGVLMGLQQHLQQQPAAAAAVMELHSVLADIVDGWGVAIRAVKR
jgi:hypothetical protein